MKRKSARRKAEGISFTLESGCAVLRKRGAAVQVRLFGSVDAARSAGLKRGDRLLWGPGGATPRAGIIDPPAGDCERIDCYLSFIGHDADDMELFASGHCVEPCDCQIYVQPAPDKPWVPKGHEKVKLKDWSGYAAVCIR